MILFEKKVSRHDIIDICFDIRKESKSCTI